MASRRILVSWIGHTDLLAMGDDLGEAGKELLAAARVSGKYGEKPGPLKTAVSREQFGEVHLLSNYPATVHKPFATWLGGKPVIHPVDLSDPTDYVMLFEVSNRVLAQVVQQPSGRGDRELCILLSPGTPAMAVVWVLLGASRYPAKFFQTYRGELREAKMPTHLFEGIVPDLIRDRDIAFSNLAAKSPQEVQGFEEIVGDCQTVREAVGRAQRAALRDVSVLLQGESGTGKELFAQAIHKASRRNSEPFRSINCAAIPKELLESELFGHVRGAFTGATSDRLGSLREANGGTVLLDEIGDMDLAMQAKLLRVIQERVVVPVGGKPVPIDVRIIAATHRDLAVAVREGRFREDLFYRLGVVPLRLPPLRERLADIVPLAEYFLALSAQPKRLSAAAAARLLAHNWPGNVRELRNAVQRATAMTGQSVLQATDFDFLEVAVPEPTIETQNTTLPDAVRRLEETMIRQALAVSGGNRAEAARSLGIHRQLLHTKMRLYGLTEPE